MTFGASSVKNEEKRKRMSGALAINSKKLIIESGLTGLMLLRNSRDALISHNFVWKEELERIVGEKKRIFAFSS